MATIMATLLPFGTIVLISVPYFVAVVAAAIYSNKHVKETGNIVEDKEDKPRFV